MRSKAGPVGKAISLTHAEIEDGWKTPKLENPHFRFGTRAFLMVRIAYDDGRVSAQPWVEGAVCPVDSFEGATFEYLGQVDARAAGLEPEELWAHQDELIAGKFRFFGSGGELTPTPRATNPDIDDTPRRRRGRSRGIRRVTTRR